MRRFVVLCLILYACALPAAAQQLDLTPDTGFSGVDLANPVNLNSPLNRGLVSWYLMLPKFNDVGSGSGKLRDLMKTNNGTYTNMSTAPTSTSGPGRTTRHGGWGQINFAGSTNYVDLADSPFDFTSDFSLALWAFPTLINSTVQSFICKAESGGYCFQIGAQTINRSNFSVHDGTAYRIAETDAVLVVNTWVHLIGVVTGTNVSVYRDGVKQTSQGTMTAAGSTINYNLSLGVNPGATLAQYFIGALDDIRIYKRALSAQEVLTLYTESRQGYPTTLNRLSLVAKAPAAAGGTPVPRQSPNWFGWLPEPLRTLLVGTAAPERSRHGD